MLAFINHFIINTVDFLNKFIANCETKFIAFETKLQHVESSLLIIESKLASVPDSYIEPKEGKMQEATKVESTAAPPKETEEQQSSQNVPEDKKTEINESKTVDEVDVDGKTEIIEEEVKGVKISEDARYKKYFKMLQFGVPAPAVKLKMAAEGVDGSLLE